MRSKVEDEMTLPAQWPLMRGRLAGAAEQHAMGPRAAFTRRDTGGETLTAIGRSYNVSHSTISRL